MGMGYVAMKRGNRIITVKQKDLRVLEELEGLELVFPPRVHAKHVRRLLPAPRTAAGA